MQERLLAKRYIDAYKSALGADKLEAGLAGLLAVSNSVVDHHAYWSYLKSPIVSLEDKQGSLNAVLSSHDTPQELGNLFSILLKKGRIGLIVHFAALAQESLLDLKNEVDVHVESAKPFSTDQEAVLVKYLKDVTDKNIRTTFDQNEEIIGGFRAHLKHTTYDATLNSLLDELSSSFSLNQVAS